MDRPATRDGGMLDKINLWLALCSGWAVVIIMLLTGFEVVMRYFIHHPTLWSVEVSEYLLVACAYLGLAYTLQEGGHVRVDLILDRLPARAQRVLNIFAFAVAVVFGAVLTWQTLALALHSFMRGIKSSTPMALPLFPTQILMPIGSFILCLQAACMFYGYVTGRLPKKEMDGRQTKEQAL